MKIKFPALLIFVSLSVSLFSQTRENEKFVPEGFLHIKLGSTGNLTNNVLFESLNSIEDGDGRFTPLNQMNFNPLVELAFERQMAKYFGLTLHLGFTQTRSRYMYDNSVYINSTTTQNFHQTGLILANVPNFGLMPTFYLKNTRFMVGTGIYKYFYRFNPMDVGYIHFDLNLEGVMIYNKVSVMQVLKLNSCSLTVTGSYFGFFRKFDHGFQVALGLAI